MKKILDSLGLGETNPGTWFGSDGSEDASALLIESHNPANGELIGSFDSFRKFTTESTPVYDDNPG